MKKLLVILLLLISPSIISQSGGRKREKSNTVRRWKIFKKNTQTSSWIYRKTESGPIQLREMPHLFRRKRTTGQKENEIIIRRQNKLRTKKRIRGNDVFHKRKYF